MIMCEYDCPHHGRFEYLETIEAQDDRPCPECGNDSPYVLSAVSVKPNYASVTQGKNSTSERPANALDTRPLADGMPLNEWRAKHGEQRKDKIRKIVRSKL